MEIIILVVALTIYFFVLVSDLYDSKCAKDIAIKKIELEIEKEKVKQLEQKSALYK
jgi:hypothetical protein